MSEDDLRKTLLYPSGTRLDYESTLRADIARNTPIPEERLHPALLGDNGLLQQPPLLWLGWVMTGLEALELIHAKGMDDLVSYLGDRDEGNVDYEDTLETDDISVEITAQAGLANGNAPYIKFVPVVRCDDRVGYALTVGDNHDCTLNPQDAAQLGDYVRKRYSELQWYLDPEHWRWEDREKGPLTLLEPRKAKHATEAYLDTLVSVAREV
ncbi:unnamed protein product [Peniophora sp. CBMAI 1063]|nr:unnamed protein product [Peniophora sp. CBMAI 1063]